MLYRVLVQGRGQKYWGDKNETEKGLELRYEDRYKEEDEKEVERGEEREMREDKYEGKEREE